MNKQLQHPMLSQAAHDEQARQDFIHSLKQHIAGQLTPGVKAVYEYRVRPRFERDYQRPPKDREEIRLLMEQDSYYQMWSVLRRTSQEMMWEAVQTSVERQLGALIERAKESSTLGSLTLNPDLPIPAYQKSVDIHCMPGSYYSEFQADDVAAGATYDRGVYLYAMGRLGPLNDGLGRSLVQHLQTQYADLQPNKILDLGCSVGHSTLPYVDAYPQAEVYAVDIAAPMVRYGHARAEALGKRVYFSQQNAEHTRFESESFDLIVSHILLHELPPPAIRKVFQEGYRLLAPGGLMLHLDAPQYAQMDPFMAFLFDWDTHHNNEPFWGAMRDLDLVSLVLEAGFESSQVIQTLVPMAATWQAQAQASKPQGGFGSRGTWFVFGGRKTGARTL